MRGRSGYQITVYILGFDCLREALRDLRRPKTDPMCGSLEFGIRESFECGIRIAGLWNPECSSRSSGIQSLDPEFTAWNPESNTVLDSLTWGDRVMPGAFGMVEGPVTLLSQVV